MKNPLRSLTGLTTGGGRPMICLGLLAALAAASLPSAWADDGESLYNQHCAACHQPDGTGAVGLAPPLAGTLARRATSAAGRQYLAGVLVAGLAGKLESQGVTYSGIMPSWTALSDDALSSILNYVLTAFSPGSPGDSLKRFQPYVGADFAPLRASHPSPKDLRAWRLTSETAAPQ